MDNIEKKLESTAKEITYFEKMVEGAEGIIEKSSRPWKWAVVGLVVAVVLCNLIWGAVHGYTIYKMYQESQTYEVSQNQEMPDHLQEQSVKGGS